MAAQQIIFCAVCGMVGLIAGCILGLNGFTQTAGQTALQQSPRLRNLGWLVTGFLGILIANPRKLSLPDDFPMGPGVVTYTLAGLAGLVFTVGWMILSYARSVRTFNAAHPDAPMDREILIREYLAFGKANADKLWAQQSTALSASQTASDTLRAQKHRELAFDADRVAAACVYGLLKQFANARLEHSERMDAVILAICAKIKASARKPLVLNGSFMKFHAIGEIDPSFPAKALFSKIEPSKCLGYLELTRGSIKPTIEVILPVAKDIDDVLPGAPEAVAARGYVMMNLNKITYRPGVPRAAKIAINKYFKHPYFDKVASVTCIPVDDGGTVYGIINIESSEPDLIGDGKEAARSVLGNLHSLVALLSVFR